MSQLVTVTVAIGIGRITEDLALAERSASVNNKIRNITKCDFFALFLYFFRQEAYFAPQLMAAFMSQKAFLEVKNASKSFVAGLHPELTALARARVRAAFRK